MEFDVYEQEAEVNIPNRDGEWEQKLGLCIDIPVGIGAAQENVEKGIMEIIASSNVAKVLGAPEGNTIKEVCDNYLTTLKSDFSQKFDEAKSAEGFSSNLYLSIRCTYQNEVCVVMFIMNGESGETGISRQYESVIRLSDGHPLTKDEIVNVSKDKLKELALEYADEAQDVDMDEDGEYCVSLGHGMLLFSPDQYFMDEYVIPLEAVEEYLTEDTKELLAADEFENETPLEPARGDLALYDLRGPVKQLQDKTDFSTTIYTFDTEGRLTSEVTEMNGDVMDDEMFYGKTVRDEKGRAVERYRGADVKQLCFYDASGFLAKEEYWVDGRLEWRKVHYYDGNGRLYKTNTKGTVSGSDYYTSTTKYFCDRGFIYDEYGNWTDMTCQKTWANDRRVITYYDEDDTDESEEELDDEDE